MKLSDDVIGNKDRYKKFSLVILLVYLSYNLIHFNDNNSFKYYYSFYLCNLIIIENQNNCEKDFLNNYDFFYNIKGIKKNVNLLIDIKTNSLIENLILIVGIIPFLKFNSSIEYRINNRNIKDSFKLVFYNKTIMNSTIFLYYYDLQVIKKNFVKIFKYIWELIPEKIIIDNIRYIINNYYDDVCVHIFEKSLNDNYEYFINKNKKIISDNYHEVLLSKY